MESKIAEAVATAMSRSGQKYIESQQENAELQRENSELQKRAALASAVLGGKTLPAKTTVPGPKPGQPTAKQDLWSIAEDILSSDAAPARGHGFHAALCRQIQPRAQASGLHHAADSIRRTIYHSLKDWESRNPK